MRKVIGVLVKLVLLLLILSILFPLGYFAWRAGQPMEMEQFNGLSYYQFLSWRKQAYQRLAEQYRLAHPGEKADTPCHELELVVHNAGAFFLGGVIVFSKVYPSLGIQNIIMPEDLQQVPDDVAWLDAFPAWWRYFEWAVWNNARKRPNGPVPYCRLQPDIPTPEELEALLDQTVRPNP